MILYPILTERLGLGDVATGVFFGATIHDVAQVVGAGYSVSQEAGDTAVFVKLLRVALLIPIVTGLSLVMGTGRGGEGGALPIPFFVLGFAALVVLGSAGLVPEEVKVALLSFSRWCLVVAIAALGTKTSLGRLAAVGGRPILLICTLTLLLALYALGLIGLLF